MVNYACGFNQSETGKCFEWIIRVTIHLLCKLLITGNEKRLIINHPAFFHDTFNCIGYQTFTQSQFLLNGLIEYIWGEVTIDCGILNRNLSNEKLHVFSCWYVIICLLSCNRQEAYHTPRWPTQSCIDCSVLVIAWKGLTCAPMTCTFLDQGRLRINT